jgi:hypothetical protein
MTEALFDMPREAYRLRRCPVCGGSLSVTASTTYVLQRQGWVKIGKTSNLPERLGVLRRSTPGCVTKHPDEMDWTEPLLVLLVIDGDVEHDLHERFASDYVTGEWFLPGPTLRAWLLEECSRVA